jgi:hypothetical protein
LCRAKSQLNKAVLAPPTCRKPVGEGAKRTRTEELIVESIPKRSRRATVF